MSDQPKIEQLSCLIVGGLANSEFAAIRIQYDTLSEFGIFPGDYLFIEQSAPFDENRITAWKRTETGDVFCGFAYENFGDVAIYNKQDKLARFRKNEVEYLGAAFCVQKSLFSAVCSAEHFKPRVEEVKSDE